MIWNRFCQKETVFLAAASAAFLANPARAEWRFDGGEGSYYAYTTDGGFVEGSYKNGLIFFCPDDGNQCDFYVTINGETPQPRAVVTFAFTSGKIIQRMAEEIVEGAPVIGWQDGLLDELLSQDSVSVSIRDGARHQFSLRGFKQAIGQAMNP